jgi:hemolysin-activating ACP:hemolysin acyltransferase
MDSPKDRPGKPRLVTLPPTLESLGAVVHFLAVDETFGAKPLAGVVLEVMIQLKNKWHLCAIRENALVGYCGWVFTTTERAEKYSNGEPIPKTNVSGEAPDAFVLTLVRIPERELVLPLIRAIRSVGPGKRVFFRRDYFDPHKPKRSSSVLNVMASGNADTANQEAPLTVKITPR